jgi:hypothetical protein
MGWDKQKVSRDSNHVDAKKPIKNDIGIQCEANKKLQALLLYHSLSN